MPHGRTLVVCQWSFATRGDDGRHNSGHSMARYAAAGLHFMNDRRLVELLSLPVHSAKPQSLPPPDTRRTRSYASDPEIPAMLATSRATRLGL